MIKAYPHYHKRTVESLNTLWDFRFLEGESMDSVNVASLSFSDKLPVPGAFDAFPLALGKRGTGVYRREIRLEPGRRGLLEFEAVSFACRILIDGENVCEHYCGYSPFNVEVPASDSEVRELVVLAENRFDFDRIPMHEHFFDFYQFGGLIRPVWLHHLPETVLEDVRIDASDIEGGTVEVRGRAVGASSVKARILDTEVSPVEAEVDGEGLFSLTMTVDRPELWSPEAPNLYRLHLDCGADDRIERFGVRRIETKEGEILLNGIPVKLLGYNRHEYFPNFGPSTPYPQMVSDIQLLKDCGCNFVRGSHYPQQQAFLDLCDEFGLLVWEENLGWGQKEEQYGSPTFRAHHDQSLREMVARSYNHPSVVIWGFMNEGGSDEEAFESLIDETMSVLRGEGGNRLSTYASNRIERDFYFEKVDLICVNLYPGWYGAQAPEPPLPRIEKDIRTFIDEMDTRGLQDMPIVISEIGCEALYGWRDEMRDFHSEEYQADYLETVCRIVTEMDRIAGVGLWHFSDARTREHSVGRARGFNNKGTFDEYRRPKLARNVVREVFLSSNRQ